MNHRDQIILEKILKYCREISDTLQYFHMDKNLFYDKEAGYIFRNSITMPILQIGELAKNLTDEFRLAHKDIPWKLIMGMRDIFAHHYGAIDYDTVWNTATRDIPEPSKLLAAILKTENEKQDE